MVGVAVRRRASSGLRRPYPGAPVSDASYGTVERLGNAASQVVDIECGKGAGSSAYEPAGSGTKIVKGSNWIVWAKNGDRMAGPRPCPGLPGFLPEAKYGRNPGTESMCEWMG